jgi:hypothetical protein
MLFVIYKPFFNAITCNFDLCMSWLSRWSMIFHKSYPYIMFFLLRLSIKMLFCSNNISAAEYLFDSKYIVCCFFYIIVTFFLFNFTERPFFYRSFTLCTCKLLFYTVNILRSISVYFGLLKIL